MYNCSGSEAYLNYFEGAACVGSPHHTTTVYVNGSCIDMECVGFTHQYYSTGNCVSSSMSTIIHNEYVYWLPNQCVFNATQLCVNGVPEMRFYSNDQCDGQATYIMKERQCQSTGVHESVKSITSDNPCSPEFLAGIDHYIYYFICWLITVEKIFRS